MVIETIPYPTTGRVVYFYDLNASTRPFMAHVADAIEDSYIVNLLVLNHDAQPRAVLNVPHVSVRGNDVQFWDWMPYQKGQAAKTEELQKQLDVKATKMDTKPDTEMGKAQAGAPSPVDGKR
jgi:hypothetical protein